MKYHHSTEEKSDFQVIHSKLQEHEFAYNIGINCQVWLDTKVDKYYNMDVILLR